MKITRILSIIVGILLLAGAVYNAAGMYTVYTNGTDYEYEYTVKAEQVNENEMVNESVSYKNLSPEEQEVLFRAFKNSDNFLEGASSEVATDHPKNVSNEWQVVEVKGVPILMAIEGPEKILTGHEVLERLYFFPVAPIIIILLTLFGVPFLLDGLYPHN